MNQCLNCADPTRLVYNEGTKTCDFVVTKVDDYTMNLNYSNMNIDTSIFGTLMTAISNIDSPGKVKYLTLLLNQNKIDNIT